MIPISRFVAVSLRPASSVLSRTFARTGRVLVGDGSTHDRQAARQVLLHDRELHVRLTPSGGQVNGAGGGVPGPRIGRVDGGYLRPIFSSPSSPSSGCGRVGTARSGPFGGVVDGSRGSRWKVDPAGGATGDGPWTVGSVRAAGAPPCRASTSHGDSDTGRGPPDCPQPGRVFHGFGPVVHTNGDPVLRRPFRQKVHWSARRPDRAFPGRSRRPRRRPQSA